MTVEGKVMAKTDAVLETIRKKYQSVLKENLVGIYVHGSLAFGCFHWERSDMDLVVVVENSLTQTIKLRLLKELDELEEEFPPKGVEISVVRRCHCVKFEYPTPYELHYSKAWVSHYRQNPLQLCGFEKKTDKDLAAHFMVIRQAGYVLCGEPVENVFGPVPEQEYLDSILLDVADAKTEVERQFSYTVLNLCRVLAYIEEKAVLSKAAGGKWGLRVLPAHLHPIVHQALEEYERGEAGNQTVSECLRFCTWIEETIETRMPGFQPSASWRRKDKAERGPCVKKGDTIGIFSPSSPITATSPVRFERAKRYLEEKGFHILEGALTGKQDGYRSGSIHERAEELNALIRDPKVRCIMSTIGGMNSNSLLPYIDYDAFKKDPKVIIGYSDVTAILLAIYAKTGIPTYYGPALVASFGEFPPLVEETYRYFDETVIGEACRIQTLMMPAKWTEEFLPWETQDRSKLTQVNQWITVQPGRAVGRLIGGNGNTMQGIFGTPYMPEIKEGDILLIEDSLKTAATIERGFSLLKLSGVLDRVGGILLGKHELFDDQGTGRKPYEILQEVLGNSDVPILADFDCCHTHPMITMPIGVRVDLDATSRIVRILSD